MSSEGTENPSSSVALAKPTEYHRRFNCHEDTEVLVSSAKSIIEENVELLRKASKRGRLDDLLHAMLDHATCDDGKRYAAIVIQMAQKKGPQEVVWVADTWERFLCMKMLTVAMRSGPSYTPDLDETHSEIENANRAEQSRLRETVSERERHRCAISGDYDYEYFLGRKADPARSLLLPPERVLSDMQVAPIFPLSLDDFNERTNSALTWDMLRAWTGRNFKELAGPAINTPANYIYMTQGLHTTFRKFRFYFDKEPHSNDSNKYRATAVNSDNTLFNGRNKTDVQFYTSGDNNDAIAPPDPWFLRIHAALARVLHACGTASYFEDVESDAGTYGTLHPNGGTDIELLLQTRLVAAD